jgi:hypothetical protein
MSLASAEFVQATKPGYPAFWGDSPNESVIE